MCLGGPSRGGGFTKRGEIVEFGDECALYASLEGVLSPNDFEQLYKSTTRHSWISRRYTSGKPGRAVEATESHGIGSCVRKDVGQGGRNSCAA